MISIDIELLTPQFHENITVIPLKTPRNYVDVLTLKKGLELGLVEVKECETSQVNTIMVKNDSITPLILIDGEEIVGGDQNRIVNSTILIDAESEMKIPVSCTEKGRWAYKSEFKQSNYIANYNTRRVKEYASRKSKQVQSAIWSSIDNLESDREFKSPTGAMAESYENLKSDHAELIKNFHVHPEQTGILIMADGEIKGLEVFLNSEIYKEFHEKILKSYLIDTEVENNPSTVNIEYAQELIDNLNESEFTKKENEGLEDAYIFENSDGIGTLYQFKNQIIHLSYFKKLDEKSSEEYSNNASVRI